MNMPLKNYGLMGVALLISALVAVLGWVMPAQGAQDIGCPDHGSGGTRNEWVVTPAAADRTLEGDCENQAGTICKEWCIVSCFEAEGQGIFSCMAP